MARWTMPELCHFYGIVVRMYFNDHAPPHFHARYGEHPATIEIESLDLLSGRLPLRARGLVIEWASLHQAELRTAWGRARRAECIRTTAPLE